MRVFVRSPGDPLSKLPREWTQGSFSFYSAEDAHSQLASIEDALRRALEASHDADYGISAKFIGIAMSLLPSKASEEAGGYVVQWGEVGEGWVKP